MSRDAIKELIRNLGGKVSSSVSNRTNYLITGENPGGKLNDAKKHNVPIISEEEFIEIAGLKN
jgi:DNA ligase (NAD+)